MLKFVCRLLLTIIPIVLVAIFYSIEIKPYRTGDLGRLGFIAFEPKYEDDFSVALDTSYIVEVESFEEVKGDSVILTIGDSFSQRGKYGYQNYLHNYFPNYKIYNITTSNIFNYAAYIIESEEKIPHIVILESVERLLKQRLLSLEFENTQSVCFKKDSTTSKENEEDYSLRSILSPDKSLLKEINDNLLQTQEYVKKYVNIENSVKHLKLDRDMFTCDKHERDLYFYEDDLFDIKKSDINTCVAKLDTLMGIFKSHADKFIFLVAADKYDMYKDFALDNPYHTSSLLDNFTKYENDIHFLNSKSLLLPHIVNGEKDIYLCNDSHWSVISARYVAKELKNRISNQ